MNIFKGMEIQHIKNCQDAEENSSLRRHLHTGLFRLSTTLSGHSYNAKSMFPKASSFNVM